MNVIELNKAISELKDKSLISDGYHTFEELYDHRCLLYLNLCVKYKDYCYYTYTNSDGSTWDGWFLLVLNYPSVKQISYHLPTELVDYCTLLDIKFKDKCDDYDGHNSADVIERLKNLALIEISDYLESLPKPEKPKIHSNLINTKGAALSLDGRKVTKEMIESWNTSNTALE